MTNKIIRYPKIILIEPQLGENIGSSARAMLNFGFTDLAIVRPREDWPNKKAIATSAGALQDKNFNVKKLELRRPPRSRKPHQPKDPE